MGGSSCFSVVPLIDSLVRRSLTAAGLSPQTVEVDGGDTTIHFWGPSTASPIKPKLVLIHGFGPEGTWQWRSQIPFFAREFDVYVPDLVFFGEYSFTKSPERTEIFQAACIAKLLDKLGIPRYSLIGTSYGGFVAYRMASMWPERVEKVVIASSAVNLRRSDNNRLVKQEHVDKIEDLLMPTNASELRRLFRLILYRSPYMPDFILNDFMQLFSENRKEKLELLKDLTIGQDDTVHVSPLSQEVLIVWGEDDQIFLLDKTVELKKLLGEKARLEVIKKASHVPQLEHPGQFNNTVKNFLQGLSS